MKVNDEIVCINDNFDNMISTISYDIVKVIILPKKDTRYHVREIVDIPGVGDGLRLVEIVNPVCINDPLFGKQEPAFTLKRFKLINE